MEDYCVSPNPELLEEVKKTLNEELDLNLGGVVQEWDTIYGTRSDHVVKELESELLNSFQKFWEQYSAKLRDTRNEHLTRINNFGKEAVHLEKALGLEPLVSAVPDNLPLVQMEEHLLSLLESYQEMKNERLKEYLHLQTKEKELCAVLDMKIPHSEPGASKSRNEDGSPSMGQYVPNSDDMTEFKDRVQQLEQLKDQLEYDFEEAKGQLYEIMEECNIAPLAKQEMFAFGDAELPVSKRNLKLLKDSVALYTKKKADLMAESHHLREQIDVLAKKMFKNPDEMEEFLSHNGGFTDVVIKKLKDKLNALKEERKSNLKELIASSREVLVEWWDRCCYCDAQRDEFKPFYATRLSEEVLDFYELEIEKLQNFYNNYKQIFLLAEQHTQLWDQLLHLENQANNKDRLFNNRGGCLLKEEKERKRIQKKVPAVKAKLMELLNLYKEETGRDFLYYGEPLQHMIEMKEQERENFKYNERALRKEANAEKLVTEARLGAQSVAGVKRRAGTTPQNPNKTKTRRMETATASQASSVSSISRGTLVRREEDVRSHLTVHTPNMRTPSVRTGQQMSTTSTPQNGSLSYESFQEHIEKSKYLAHNSTRKNEQRTLRPKNLNQTRTLEEKKTPFRTPKTPGRTFKKTPTITPSRIPFRIPTGSKIPSQVPPVSPRRKPALALSATKLPIIF